MAEYIDREEAIRFLSNPITMSMCLKLDECKYKRQQRETDLELIKSLPAADVQPVKHGRWKRKRETLGRGPLFAEICVWQCTACKCVTPVEVDRYKYCPNCGARMDGET